MLWASTWLLAIVLAAVIPLAAITPMTFTALWLWIGASLVLAATRGCGGCEILAFPNILTGRRDEVGCILFTPIDQAEARGWIVAVEASPRRWWWKTKWPPECGPAPSAARTAGGGADDRPTLLRGDSVVLRPLRVGDAERTAEIQSEPEVVRWWALQTRLTSDERQKGTTPRRALAIEREGELVGLIQYHEENNPESRHASIGLFLAERSQGDSGAPVLHDGYVVGSPSFVNSFSCNATGGLPADRHAYSRAFLSPSLAP